MSAHSQQRTCDNWWNGLFAMRSIVCRVRDSGRCWCRSHFPGYCEPATGRSRIDKSFSRPARKTNYIANLSSPIVCSANTMIITLYGIPNCDSVKKARTCLNERGIDDTFHTCKRQGALESELPCWVEEKGWDIILNRIARHSKISNVAT